MDDDYSHLDPEYRALLRDSVLDNPPGEGKGKATDYDTASDSELAVRLQNLERASARQYVPTATERRQAEHRSRTNPQSDFSVGPGLLERWRRDQGLERTPPPPTAAFGEGFNPEEDEDEDDFLELLAAESSRMAAILNKTHRRSTETNSCTACGEDDKDVEMVECPCTHPYCKECIQHLFKASLSDETMFPPKCCNQPIPVEAVKDLLDAATVEKYEAKKVEFATPSRERTCCHAASCATFIPASADPVVDKVAVCPKCNKKTCRTCKAASHPGSECPTDDGTQQVLELGKEKGWQKCYSCGNLVELNTGCNRIICRCGADFCYGCGREWRTCNCGANFRHPGQVIPGTEEDFAWLEQHVETRREFWQQQQQQQQQPQFPLELDMEHDLALLPAPSHWHVHAARGLRLPPPPSPPLPAGRRGPVGMQCDHQVADRLEGPNVCELCFREKKHFILECVFCGQILCERCQRKIALGPARPRRRAKQATSTYHQPPGPGVGNPGGFNG